jgi:hypothetical protein
MTIAAGFQCSDGVALCADTQITIPGVIKYPESIIRSSPDAPWKPFFVFAGDGLMAKMAILQFAACLQKAKKESRWPVEALM